MELSCKREGMGVRGGGDLWHCALLGALIMARFIPPSISPYHPTRPIARSYRYISAVTPHTHYYLRTALLYHAFGLR